jgi:TonB family protein
MGMLLAVGALLAQASSPQLPAPMEIRVPEYPEIAVKAQMADTVEVEETISSTGAVVAAKVNGKANPLLGAEALKAAREWTFDGSAAPTRRYVIKFEFAVDVAGEAETACYVGPSSATVSLPTQTVRIRGWLRPGLSTEVY